MKLHLPASFALRCFGLMTTLDTLPPGQTSNLARRQQVSAHMHALLQEMGQALQHIREGGGHHAVERHRRRNKM
eukprot:1159395-Pelagomonas_calceolata.AAC.4